MKNYLDLKRQIVEKHLTAAEKNKREEIAQAIEKKNPDMPMGKKMAIATAQAKKVAEEIDMDMFAEELVNEIAREVELDEGIKDFLFKQIGKAGAKLFGTGGKSATDLAAGKAAERAADATSSLRAGPKTGASAADDAAAFTKSELDRIAKKAGEDARALRAGPQTGAKVADDIKPTPPAKGTQPRDSGGRFVSGAAKAADDVKAVAPGAGRAGTLTGKLGKAAAVTGAAALGGAIIAGVDKSSSVDPSAAATDTPKNDDRSSKEPSAPASSTPNYDDMSFGQAFAAARKAAETAGAKSTGRFNYKGKEYQTNVKGEKYVSRSNQTAVGESFEKIVAGSIDEAILMSMAKLG